MCRWFANQAPPMICRHCWRSGGLFGISTWSPWNCQTECVQTNSLFFLHSPAPLLSSSFSPSQQMTLHSSRFSGSVPGTPTLFLATLSHLPPAICIHSISKLCQRCLQNISLAWPLLTNPAITLKAPITSHLGSCSICLTGLVPGSVFLHSVLTAVFLKY